MSLLDQASIDALIRIAQTRVERHREGLRRIIWTGTPPGMKRIEMPSEKQAFSEHLVRRATQEQSGVMPGDLSRTALGNPHVVEALDG